MTRVAKLLADALALSEAEREDLAAQLLDSLEPPPGISVVDEAEIRRRAQESRDGAPGAPWAEVKSNVIFPTPYSVPSLRPAETSRLGSCRPFADEVKHRPDGRADLCFAELVR